MGPARDATAGLAGFRAGLHQAVTGWADTVFELCDAILCAPGPVRSLPALSLEPVFRRGHGSLYKGLDRGGIDAEKIRDLLAAHYPDDWGCVFAVDASTWPRDDAETSPGRGYHHCPSGRTASGRPVVAGWSYQWIAGLDQARGSWAAPLDVARLPPGADTTAVAAAQIRALTARLAASGRTDTPTFVFDAGYDPAGLTWELAGLDARLVVRIRDDRVFHTAPDPPAPGTPGRPRRHGERRSCAHPDTWPAPDATIDRHDDHHGHLHIDAWHGLHPRLTRRRRWAAHAQPPIVTATIIRLTVEHPPRPARHPHKPLWLWTTGSPDTPPDPLASALAYLHRFDIEHMSCISA